MFTGMKIADYPAEDIFADENGDDSLDWHYCNEHATFHHKDACEFIIYLGHDDDSMNQTFSAMDDYGCSRNFIDALRQARNEGFTWILLWA